MSDFIRGEGHSFFDPTDGAIGEAIPGDPVIQGMQMAMLQESAPPELMFEASSKFQRSWYEAAVIERVLSKQCGWPQCRSSLPSTAGKRKGIKNTTGDDIESYCSAACRYTSLGFARALPYRINVIPKSAEMPVSSFQEEATTKEEKKKTIRPKKRQPQKKVVVEDAPTQIEIQDMSNKVSEQPALASNGTTITSPPNTTLPYELTQATSRSMEYDQEAINAAASAIARGNSANPPPLKSSPNRLGSNKLSALMAEMKMADDEKKKADDENQDGQPKKKESLFKKKRKTVAEVSKNLMNSPVSMNVSERKSVGPPKPMPSSADKFDAGNVEGYTPTVFSTSAHPPLRSLFPPDADTDTNESQAQPPLWPWGAPTLSPSQTANQPNPTPDASSLCQPCSEPQLQPISEGMFEADVEFKVLTPAQVKEMSSGGKGVEAVVANMQQSMKDVTSSHMSDEEDDEEDRGSYQEEDLSDYEDEEEWRNWEESISTYMKALELLESWRTANSDAFAEHVATQRLKGGKEPFMGIPTYGNKTSIVSPVKLLSEVERQEALFHLLEKEKTWLEETLFSPSGQTANYATVEAHVKQAAQKSVKFMMGLFTYVAAFPFALEIKNAATSHPENPPSTSIATAVATSPEKDESTKFWRLILLVLFAVTWPSTDKNPPLTKTSPTGSGLIHQFGSFLAWRGIEAKEELGVDQAEFNALCYIFIENLKC